MIKKILKMTAFASAVYALDRLKLVPVVAVLAYWVDLQRPHEKIGGGGPAVCGPPSVAAL